MKTLLFAICSLFITGCVGSPRGVTTVDGFDLERYLGTWYEIARLDHRFERGLSKVSASYTKRNDGGIDVLNRGFNRQTGIWKEAKGRAYLVGTSNKASLKVSFFWPFYAGYNIIDLDRNDYQYALVCGPNKNYLWILARTKHIEKSVVEGLVAKADEYGFEIKNLIFVDHGN
ncbi:MAG: lipocalin [Desulfuromonas sp.]|nr:MAG: lipocalin [Desulfuromonas sp.]